MSRSPLLTSLLFSIGLIGTSAQSAEYARADLVTDLSRMGMISLRGIVGNPQDVERRIAHQADQRGARYYRILHMWESDGQQGWQATAALYR
ncbi:DUF1471 domain-containing protein [Edwardsiella piscicida]|uniref:YdgH/BhsA/McbA-like domain-containing protein n=3 Tax=Edwardsiella TaxID=635 RepID=A0A0H3DPH4_EDWTF|nr:DUF1471 domain-containing protein [Edwardsiella piscicida]ACY83209.1 hypothetical protein ETAE_0362 [Edwardsiella tarda EIB202]ADM40440.1 hypothetical protein ETAF_0316 [Edwardsiella tarda FL6-60]AGH72449.1 hypothetical protein ETAC_01580 [Edwardsiella piscicida C07-087]AOP41848.1 DUF1471 domain-containing protein [Edwardsiella piscicida]ARD17974.1 hypothetical protein BXA22_06275 [Edwardsiella piscicida]